MKINLKSGKYVVAVSGGVDSVVLLDILTKQPELELIVAHFDHGIREDSAEDRKFVESLARKYNLPFEYAEGHLGAKVSEATARTARYNFLNKVCREYQAQAIITAHHQDDLLETAILNWLRGTGRRGLSSLKSTETIRRPLLQTSKQDLLAYAKKHNLAWHEDSTNTNEAYLRNYIRRQIMPRLSAAQRARLLDIIERASSTNRQIDGVIDEFVHSGATKQQLNRKWFTALPHTVAREVMAGWLRQNDLPFDKRLIERLVAAAKTYRAGKYIDVTGGYRIKIGQSYLALERMER